MGNFIFDAGYKSYSHFIYQLVLPIILTSIIISIISFFLFELAWYLSIAFFPFGLMIILIVPFLYAERKKVEIHERLHLFITYAGTLATMQVNRTVLFQKIAEEKEYGELRNIAERIVYLAKKWNLGYAKTCRKVAAFTPSLIFKDFLDRLAFVMDFGEDLQTFLVEEQDAIMDDFENQYRQSIQNIKLLEDVFISLTISIAFAMAAALLLPLLMGIDIMIIVQYSLLGLVFMDLLLIVMIKAFIPSDNLCHNLQIIDKGTKKLIRSFIIIAPISFLLTAILIYLDFMPFLFNFAIGFTPLLIVGILATREENEVFRRDKSFPPLIRALGGTTSTKGGSVTSSLGALRVHDFGSLNEMVINVYRRLRVGSERFKCWLYFAGETGSNLINYFIHIFVKSIYLGGDGIKVSEIISKNFSRLLGLRKLRLQLAAGLRGALYGALLGFVTTVYMAAAITGLLSGMFDSIVDDAQEQEDMEDLISTIIPQMPEIDMESVNFYIAIIVIFHSLISSIIIKIVDGGSKYAALMDFIIMVWIGAGLSFGIPLLSEWAFGDLVLAN
ncbi:MAG: hypothetical protein ACOCZQ_03835 [Nanoarchaeota archaeon]